jgi:hypothetical protein
VYFGRGPWLSGQGSLAVPEGRLRPPLTGGPSLKDRCMHKAWGLPRSSTHGISTRTVVDATVMGDTLHLQMSTFTPSEVYQITGVPPVMQRDWRRRGLIETSRGGRWTRVTTDDLIQLLTMRALSTRKIPPGFARQLGRMAILPVLKRLVAEAYPDTAVEVERTASASLWIQGLLEQAALERGLDPIERQPTGNASLHSGTPGNEPRFLIYAEAENEVYKMYTSNSVEEFIKTTSYLKRRAGEEPERYFVYIVVDIAALSEELMDNQIKPYFEPRRRDRRRSSKARDHAVGPIRGRSTKSRQEES